MKFLIALPMCSSIAYAFWAFFIAESISFYGSNYASTLLIVFIVSSVIALLSGILGSSKIRRLPEKWDVLTGVFYAIGNIALFSVVNSKSLLVVYAISYLSVLLFLFDGKNLHALASSAKRFGGILAAVIVLLAGVIYLYISFNASSPSLVNLFSVAMGLVAALFYAIGGMLSVRVSYERESIPSKWMWISVIEVLVTFVAVLVYGFKATPQSLGASAIAGVLIAIPFSFGFLSYSYTKYLRGIRKVVDKEIIYSIPELDIVWLAILYGTFISALHPGDIVAIAALALGVIYLYTIKAK